MGFNQHLLLPGHFDLSLYDDIAIKDEYGQAHCLPTTEQVVAQLKRVRREHHMQCGEMLRWVYVLLNGWAL